MNKWTSWPKPDTYRLKIGLWTAEIKKSSDGWTAKFDGKPLRVRGGFRSASCHKVFPKLADAKKAILTAAKKELKAALTELDEL